MCTVYSCAKSTSQCNSAVATSILYRRHQTRSLTCYITPRQLVIFKVCVPNVPTQITHLKFKSYLFTRLLFENASLNLWFVWMEETIHLMDGRSRHNCKRWFPHTHHISSSQCFNQLHVSIPKDACTTEECQGRKWLERRTKDQRRLYFWRGEAFLIFCVWTKVKNNIVVPV